MNSLAEESNSKLFITWTRFLVPSSTHLNFWWYDSSLLIVRLLKLLQIFHSLNPHFLAFVPVGWEILDESGRGVFCKISRYTAKTSLFSLLSTCVIAPTSEWEIFFNPCNRKASSDSRPFLSLLNFACNLWTSLWVIAVEFALHPQHEASCDSEIQTGKDFKNKFRKQLGSSPTTSLNSEGKEETLECLKSWTELRKNENGHWICKHLIYKDVVLCIYLNYRIFTLRLQKQVTTRKGADQNLIKTILSTILIKI